MARTERASASYEEPTKNVADHERNAVVLPPSKARAGRMDRNTFYMLVASTLLVICLFAVTFAYFKPA
jgi:hypothetical protein